MKMKRKNRYKEMREDMLESAILGDETTLKNNLLLVPRTTHWIRTVNHNGDNLIHLAVRHEQVHILRMLFDDWGAKEFINYTNKSGKTPLHVAAQIFSIVLTDYLISQGAEVDALSCGSWTPLMIAVSKFGTEGLQVVTSLLRHNANPNVQNKDGWTILHIASRSGDQEIVKFLLDKFPFLVSVTSNNGRYPIHTAALHGHFEVVEMLLNAVPGQQFALDACGSLPIHDASRSDNSELVKHLMTVGPDANQCDAMGLNCLHMAAQAGATEVITFLLNEFMMDINGPNLMNNFTPLHYAVQGKRYYAIKQLLRCGADHQSKDKEGRTPLDLIEPTKQNWYLELLEPYQ